MSNAPSEHHDGEPESAAHSPLTKPARSKINPVVEGLAKRKVQRANTEEPQPTEPPRGKKRRKR